MEIDERRIEDACIVSDVVDFIEDYASFLSSVEYHMLEMSRSTSAMSTKVLSQDAGVSEPLARSLESLAEKTLCLSSKVAGLRSDATTVIRFREE